MAWKHEGRHLFKSPSCQHVTFPECFWSRINIVHKKNAINQCRVSIKFYEKHCRGVTCSLKLNSISLASRRTWNFFAESLYTSYNTGKKSVLNSLQNDQQLHGFLHLSMWPFLWTCQCLINPTFKQKSCRTRNFLSH